MADVIGRIAPEVDIREVPAWTEPSRTLVLSDASGKRHGRIEWIESEMGDDFNRALLELFAAATRKSPLRATSPASAS